MQSFYRLHRSEHTVRDNLNPIRLPCKMISRKTKIIYCVAQNSIIAIKDWLEARRKPCNNEIL